MKGADPSEKDELYNLGGLLSPFLIKVESGIVRYTINRCFRNEN